MSCDAQVTHTYCINIGTLPQMCMNVCRPILTRTVLPRGNTDPVPLIMVNKMVAGVVNPHTGGCKEGLGKRGN